MSRRLLAVVGPGLLVAATGVGAGDLATGAFAGVKLGPAILWAVLVGAGLKFVLTEGLARWQLVTGETVFSSLLGVWQAVPYIFAEYLGLVRGAPRGAAVDTRGGAYRSYLFAIASVPAIGLCTSFATAPKLYAIVGACFLPLLALVLLLLNGRAAWMGEHRNRPLTAACLLGTLLFFGWFGWARLA